MLRDVFFMISRLKSRLILILSPSLMVFIFFVVNFLTISGISFFTPIFLRNMSNNRPPPSERIPNGFDPTGVPPNQLPPNQILGQEINMDSSLFEILPILLLISVLIIIVFSVYIKIERKLNNDSVKEEM